MSRPRATAFFIFVLSTLALVLPARADKRAEALARDALKKAESDYLAADYSAGAARLEKALRACKVTRCAPETRALLLRDLGTMQFESGDRTAAALSWGEALKLLPGLDLNSDYEGRDVRVAWEAEKSGSANPSTVAKPDAIAVATGAAPAEQPSADIERAPSPEQEQPRKADTPLESDARFDWKPEPPAFARLWIGITGTIDFLAVPTGDDVCKLSGTGQPANSAGFYCTNPDGTDFPSRASQAQNLLVSTRGQAGHVDGGIKGGNQRVMLAVDYAVTPNLLAGGRFGYVIGSYTGDVAVKDGRAFGSRLHAELRATYVFGRAPLRGDGFAPLVFVGGGVSEFDGSSATAVTLSGIAGQHPVDAWLTDGPFFIAMGGGARYLFSPRVAFTAAVRFNAVFGGNGFLPSFGPEIGAQYGF